MLYIIKPFTGTWDEPPSRISDRMSKASLEAGQNAHRTMGRFPRKW